MLLSTISLRSRHGSVGAHSINDTASRSPAPTSIFGFEVVRRVGAGAGSTIYAVRGGADVRQGGCGGGGADDIVALKHVIRREEKDIRFIEQLEAEHEAGHRVCHAGVRRTFDLRISRNLFRR